jgi:hypothetical protein
MSVSQANTKQYKFILVISIVWIYLSYEALSAHNTCDTFSLSQQYRNNESLLYHYYLTDYMVSKGFAFDPPTTTVPIVTSPENTQHWPYLTSSFVSQKLLVDGRATGPLGRLGPVRVVARPVADQESVVVLLMARGQ